MDSIGIVYLLGVVLGVVLIVCWIVLPFAIIGTKPLLRDLLREQRRTNELLEGKLRANAARREAGPPKV